MNAELRDNTNELNTKIEELRVELLSFQNLSDTLKKENDMYLKERNYYLLQESSRKLAEEHLNQSLQQYKEQLQFKTLENQKLREVETELRKQIQDLEYDAEQMDRRCLVELKERNIVIVSLQEEYGQYKKEAEKKEELLKQEGMAAMQLVMSKSQELHILEEDLKHLREKLNSTNIEHEKILHQNEKALNEISSLYRSKEVQCFELEQKLNTLEATAAEIDEEHPRKQELDIANALPTDEISHVKSNC
ncbi:hypothetical protein RI129_000727 [Pyrocoelia pectoralis]|uniref:Uncharacterized protein n=1 Tax=Pyrocoelia pectoralis TaxID=417401 RepID=A0AAN7VTK4_9COLE